LRTISSSLPRCFLETTLGLTAALLNIADKLDFVNLVDEGHKP